MPGRRWNISRKKVRYTLHESMEIERNISAGNFFCSWVFRLNRRQKWRSYTKIYTESGSRRREDGPESGLVLRTVEIILRGTSRHSGQSSTFPRRNLQSVRTFPSLFYRRLNVRINFPRLPFSQNFPTRLMSPFRISSREKRVLDPQILISQSMP